MFGHCVAQASFANRGFLRVIEVALVLIVQEIRNRSRADQEQRRFTRDDIPFVRRITCDNFATPGGCRSTSNSLGVDETGLTQEQYD